MHGWRAGGLGGWEAVWAYEGSEPGRLRAGGRLMKRARSDDMTSAHNHDDDNSDNEVYIRTITNDKRHLQHLC